MRFSEFCNEEKKGTYVGGRFSKDVEKGLEEFCKDNDIPNINTDYHTTIMFSRSKLEGYESAGKVQYDTPLHSFKIFEGDTKVLVLQLDSPDLKARHEYLMKEYDGTYDFPDYIPHITLSYDLEDYDINTLDIEDLDDIDFFVQEEYTEELNLDWKNTKGED